MLVPTMRVAPGARGQGPNLSLGTIDTLLHTGANQRDVTTVVAHMMESLRLRPFPSPPEATGATEGFLAGE